METGASSFGTIFIIYCTTFGHILLVLSEDL